MIKTSFIIVPSGMLPLVSGINFWLLSQQPRSNLSNSDSPSPTSGTSPTILFQSIMASESVPDGWKEANGVPVYKGGSRNVATNYRPISLTSQLCKVFETIVRDQGI